MIRALVIATVALCAGQAFAQEAPKTPATPVVSTPSVEVTLPASEAANDEEIIVQGYRDRAMNAYLRGDFEAAERAFGENLSCIQRVQTLREFAFEQARSDSLMSEVNAGTGGALESGQVSTTSSRPSSLSLQNRRARVPERTCEGPDWQLYMMGMSQIGRGNFSEAKETLYRVVRMSNNQYLFDAHYRVGLLEVLDGNLDQADRRLTHLRRMQRLCVRRGEDCEIGAEIDEAVGTLETSISTARSRS